MSADKVCSKCGRLLPIERFRRSGVKNGYRPECKACSHLIEVSRKVRLPESRVGTACGKKKKITQFPHTVGQYRLHRCRSCENARKLADYYKRAAEPGYQQKRAERIKRAKLQRRMQAAQR